MSILIKPKLVSVDTEEYLPSHSKGKIENDSEETNGEAVFTEVSTKVSNLPYYIAYHRKRADRLFLHARGKENGLKHVDIRKGFLAIFWIIVFIVTMIVFIMMATNLFEQYDSGRVATQIKAEQDVMIFPDVTICAKVPFYVDDENAKNENTTDYILKKSEELIRKKLRDSSLRQTKSNIEAALLIEMAMKRENSFMRAYEHFIYCKYNDKDCSFYNFTEIVHLRYIQCFTFSPNDKVISGNKGLEFIFYKRHSRGKPFVMLNDLEDELFSSDIYDGINVIVHNPDTFPTYAFNYLSTSFALRYGQLATVDVSGLKYKSDMTGRKSCFPQRDPYRQVFTLFTFEYLIGLYTNFRGGANFLEYRYTYEDCIANMKQRYIYEKCNCYSDHLFVPFQDPKNNDSVYRSSYDTADLMNNPNVNEKQEDESIQKFSHFCRDIRHKTSHRLRNEFLCFEQYQKMPTTSVLDKFVQPDKLYATRHNLDARKIERHKVCSLLCEKVSSEELTHGNTDVQHDNKVFKTDLPKKRMKVSHSSKHSADTLNKQRNSNTKPASTQQITHDNNDKINRRNQLLINEDDFQENTTWTLDRNNILNSDKFPFLYPPPPPALQKQTLNEKNEYDIYAISDDSYLKNPLQPILDQSVVPDYLFQRYAHSPF
uniref:Amiloride-sensitive sodium channel n=1 Tax=Trichobilharzia regenti TaxID=157069 RepID=A0AA85JCY1_TRIRE|nr:unnamed protein product [Trichobilharzia regenti]